jgi:uncharacterized protein (TIGR02145 family)
MKKTILTLAIFITSIALYAQVKISTGGGNPDPSSMLEVESNNKGFLMPRLANPNTIASPAVGLQVYNTTTNCINIFNGTTWLELCGTLPVGTIASLNCAGATQNGTLTAGVAASGVNSVVAYTGGNGGTHNGQTVTSTGVTGLTATLTSGTFANGGGTLTYTITGTPLAAGTASFVLNIGGQVCTLTLSVVFNCGTSTLTDSRDNVNYNTLLIGNQCWMRENLRYLPSVSSTSTTSLNSPHYYVYGYTGTNVTTAKSTSNYSTYGVWYNWTAAMNGSSSSTLNPSGVQGVCPQGWHLPSKDEWDEMVTYLGGTTVAGGKMKSTTLWSSTNASNSSGFTAFPGGSISFGNILNNGFWWSSTEQTDPNKAWMVDIWNGNVYFSWSNWNLLKSDGQSVRCIKD